MEFDQNINQYQCNANQEVYDSEYQNQMKTNYDKYNGDQGDQDEENKDAQTLSYGDEDRLYKPTYVIEDFLPESRGEIKDWTCQLCKGIFYFPLATSCGHTFCKECITKYLSLNSNCCPIEGKQISSELIDIVLVRSILERQDIYCTNRSKGCNWIGKYKQQPIHKQTECHKELINCSYEGCTVKFLRENELKHRECCLFKTTQCEYCSNIVIQHRYKQHINECERYPIKCNLCEKVVVREDINKHLQEECEEQETKCIYFCVGCTVQVKRKNLTEHNKSMVDVHVDLVNKRLLTFEETLETKLDVIVEKIVNISLKKILSNQTNYNKFIDYNKLRDFVLERFDASDLLGKKRASVSVNLTQNNQNNKEKEGGKRFNSLSLTSDNNSDNYINIEDQDNSKKFQRIPSVKLVNVDYLNTEIDLSCSSCGVKKIDKLKALVEHPDQGEKFVLTNLNVNVDNKIFRWKVRCNKISKWCGIGIGARDVIMKNGYKYGIVDINNKSKLNNGCFLITSNGYLANSNNNDQNMVRESYAITSGAEVEIIYNSGNGNLDFSIPSQRYKISLTRVEAESHLDLVPVVVLYSPGDSVEFEFNN